ncbi:nck-associated protein 5 isoform X2 [Amia ocellicauda]|uniref:nck-associated protein 5 isoform X2 n=1 Tax=Amia ocellicauda TaxID=2972642 RepID=UPI0034648DA3
MAGSRHLEKRELWKRLSLDSSLVEYMDSNKCIEELLKQLEEEHRNVRREKLAVARLQREVARSKSEGTMREKLIHELEEERRLRLESEKRLREVTVESELSRTQMVSLQQQFSRMEETVRSLLQNQGPLEQTAVDTMDIMNAYKDKLSEEVRKQKESMEEVTLVADEESPSEGSGTEEERDKTKSLLDRLRALEAENSALALENENQREQYERCLDEVANQVVQALLTQKDLREECLKLRTRVFDLEQQNRTLSVLFQQRVRPASDLLLQKLHSRIMDLSAGDLLLEPERSKSFLQSRIPETPFHESQQNVKPGVPVVKCQSQLSLTVPTQLYPRSSCSSSELSLSSACSEFSSGSYTWNDGKSCSRVSSQTWEKRVSIGSSAPSSISSPAEEQPPTRKKESHILEGLKKLQKRKPMEPSSLISKWGYKDCMNSNEGIYSPGVKCVGRGVPKSHTPSKPTGLCPNREHGKKFTYDSDSHDDADDESTNAPPLRHEIPSKDCRTYSKKLTHSISDSLFSWEQRGKVATGNPSYFNSRERPEKLTSFINGFLSGENSRAILGPPVLRLEASPTEMDCNLQFSDIDDLEVLEELRIESSDEKSTAVTRLAEKQGREAKRLSGEIDKQTLQCEKDQGRLQPPDIRPKTFNLIKQHKIVKNTSSEECITVIFDAEDGEPIELSSQQTGVVSVTRNEISVNQQQSVASAEYTELIPQGRSNCQKGSNARNYSVLESPESQAEQQPDNMAHKNAILPSACADAPSERLPTHFPKPQKLIKPSYNSTHKINPVSPMHSSSSQKANLTKIPSRGKGSPQKVSKASVNDTSNNNGTSSSAFQEKSPSSPPVKLSRFIKPPGGGCVQNPKAEPGVSKLNSQPQQSSKIPCRNEWGKGSSTTMPGSPLLPRRHLEPVDYGEQPTRDRHCDSAHTELRSPSPPPPPGRSASLLIRPNYENAPLALKPHLPASNALRGGPPSSQMHLHHPLPLPDTQHPNPHKSPDSASLDDGHCPEMAPQKLVDNASQHLQRPPGTYQTPTKGSPKRVPAKLYHPSPAPGCVSDFCENASKSSKVHNSQRGCSLQSAFSTKKGPSCENGFPLLYKTSSSLPISLQGHSQTIPEAHGVQTHPSPVTRTSPSTGVSLQNSEEKVSKTRIPIGLKAFVKSPPLLRKSSTVPGKQEKDNINSASRGTVTSSNFNNCDASQGSRHFEMVSAKSDQEIKTDMLGSPTSGETHSLALSENGGPFFDKGDGESRLFKRSVSVTNKTHLKPALGMNGAKARSQSFSTHSGEKPCTNVMDGPGKIRTQIITNTAERGNSLTRQNSLIDGFQLKPGSGPCESPSHSPRGVDCSYNRQGSHGSMSSSSSHHGSPSKIASRTTPKGDSTRNASKADGSKSPPQKEARSLPLADRFGLKNSRQPVKVASHPQFHIVTSPVFVPEMSAEAVGSRLLSPNKLEMIRPVKNQDNPSKAPEVPEKLVSPSVSTIEEKVMMGIQENMQKGHGQDKTPASETKQKTGPSLANWFGFRKSKLPALSGKKADASKAKDEKKDLKIGSVLGGKQVKADKKKDKKKNEPQSKDSQEQTKKSENGDKLGSIIDHCNSQMGQPGKLIQCSTTCIGKEQFMKELLNRSVSKGNSQGPALPGISINAQGNYKRNGEMKGDMDIHNESASKIMTQTINIITDNDEEPTTESTCQDHMIGSSCQMRTLDSGIGTFPLPDSVNRPTGRHLPKSESSPERALSVSPEPADHHPLPTPPKAKTVDRQVPSDSGAGHHKRSDMGHSLSDSTMIATDGYVFQSQLPLPTASGPMKLRRASEREHGSVSAQTPGDCENRAEDLKNHKEPHGLHADRTLRVCTYPGSSSESESEYESSENSSCRDTLSDPMKNSRQVAPDEPVVKKSIVANPMSIMDFYHVHFGEEAHKDVSQYGFMHKDSSTEGKTEESPNKTKQAEEKQEEPKMSSFSKISLESLNKINSNSGIFAEKDRKTGNKAEGQPEGRGGTEEASSSCSDKPGLESLSDSLYDSFSSCASQGSNEV